MRLARSLLLLLALAVAAPIVGCDKGKDSKSKKDKDKDKDKDDDDDDKKSKKSSKDKDDEDEPDDKKKADKKPVGVEVPGVAGFVVPPGGVHKHIDMPIGDKTLSFENYTYPVKDFPRDKLRESFQKTLTDAGWKVAANGAVEYLATKGSLQVKTMFGEAEPNETKINVFPAEGAAPGASTGTPTPVAGDTPLYAGSYTSAWGTVTLEQASATPTTVTGRYSRGVLKCTTNGAKLDCSWAESSSSGRAAFTRDAEGNVNGTWGSGGSATSGGPWNLKLKTAGQLK